MEERLGDTDDRLTEQFDCDGAEDEAEDEVRYGLTAQGATLLEECRSFAGFGPCSAMRPIEAGASASNEARRRIRRARTRRATSLFG